MEIVSFACINFIGVVVSFKIRLEFGVSFQAVNTTFVHFSITVISSVRACTMGTAQVIFAVFRAVVVTVTIEAAIQVQIFIYFTALPPQVYKTC